MHKSVNLAMQSTNPKTLKEIKRDNISIEDYKVLQNLLKIKFQHIQI